jgi:hypothetical protein
MSTRSAAQGQVGDAHRAQKKQGMAFEPLPSLTHTSCFTRGASDLSDVSVVCGIEVDISPS